MKVLALLLLAAATCAAGSALAQQPSQGRGAQMQKQGMKPGERGRERMERKDGERRHFSREERSKLRQDLLDANREMKGRR
jgi:Ni/Co efflux regulator RcnB